MDRYCFANEIIIGVSDIDEQHKHILDIADKLYDAIMLHNTDGIDGIVLQLVEYTHYHFATEESYMKHHNFPGLAKHKKEHAALIDKLNVRIAQSLATGTTDLENLYAFVITWITGHIINTDIKMVRDIQLSAK